MAANVRHDSRVHLIAPLALLDALLARPALVVESNDALGRAAHVRHDEADAIEAPAARLFQRSSVDAVQERSAKESERNLETSSDVAVLLNEQIDLEGNSRTVVRGSKSISNRGGTMNYCASQTVGRASSP